jgi:hypothetical protein
VAQQTQQAAPRLDPGFDRLNRDWYIDKLVQLLVFLGGISAIVFIIGISISGSSSSRPTGGPPPRPGKHSAFWRWLPARPA